MNTIKLTPDNVSQYIGREILFRTRGNYIVKRIIRISDTCKTVYIDHPDLKDSLEIVSRKVYVIIE